MYLPFSNTSQSSGTWRNIRSIALAVIVCVIRTPMASYAAVVAPVLLLLVLAGTQPWVPISFLTRDPMAIAEETGLARFYFGALSNLGIMALCFAVGAGALGAMLARRAGAAPRDVAFPAAGAMIAAFLAVDDMFMIHENRTLAAFHVEYLLFAVYGLSLALYLVVYRNDILGSPWGGILLMAVCAFALSILADIVKGGGRVDSPYWLIEDGFKLLGYISWTAFQFLVALDARSTGRGT